MYGSSSLVGTGEVRNHDAVGLSQARCVHPVMTKSGLCYRLLSLLALGSACRWW